MLHGVIQGVTEPALVTMAASIVDPTIQSIGDAALVDVSQLGDALLDFRLALAR